MSNLVIF